MGNWWIVATGRMVMLPAVALVTGACLDKGLTVAGSDADAETADASPDSAGQDAAADTAGQDAAADTAGQDAVADTAGQDAVADTAPPGPTCYQGLSCLVEQKQWSPGDPIPQGDCLENMSDGEMTQVDAVLACVDLKCLAEYDAWYASGGAADLSALYLCLVEKCPASTAVCAGGHGDKDCGDALYCMAACPPLDQSCTVPCLEQTSEAQSVKTGAFLECVFAACTLSEIPACIPNSCVLKCPELAG